LMLTVSGSLMAKAQTPPTSSSLSIRNDWASSIGAAPRCADGIYDGLGPAALHEMGPRGRGVQTGGRPTTGFSVLIADNAWTQSGIVSPLQLTENRYIAPA
jgi:hypothetical protein